MCPQYTEVNTSGKVKDLYGALLGAAKKNNLKLFF